MHDIEHILEPILALSLKPEWHRLVIHGDNARLHMP
jgi:hypothetical protein